MSKSTLRCKWPLLVLGCVLLSGCATGSLEDDEFFNRGWIWPRDLDKPARRSQAVQDAMPPEEPR